MSVAARRVACKVCGDPADLFDVVDFSKNCCEPMGLVLPHTGRDVAYHRCARCGFIFTLFCDGFTAADFAREIYNADYLRVDPLYPSIRPTANAAFVRRVLADACRFPDAPRLVDFGAGSGTMAALLGASATVTSFDPFTAAFSEAPEGVFDVVFASEVLEHVTAPLATMNAMRDLLRPGGVMLFSTMVPPADIAATRAAWWYLSPRNGHVSVYAHASLARLCAQAGLRYTPLSDEWHAAEHLAAPCAHLDRARLLALTATLPTGFIDV